MGLNMVYSDGQTPIDEDEKEELILKNISTKEELDQFEQINIEKAVQWTIRKSNSLDKILTEEFIKDVHKRMFGEVWKWAGQFRKTDKTLGIDKHQISIEVRQLLDNTRYWIENKTFADDEIAIRFKHRIVQIHCFSNGNGRHSRLLADILTTQVFHHDHFTWGQNLPKQNHVRKNYLTALRLADANNFDLLISFARS